MEVPFGCFVTFGLSGLRFFKTSRGHVQKMSNVIRGQFSFMHLYILLIRPCFIPTSMGKFECSFADDAISCHSVSAALGIRSGHFLRIMAAPSTPAIRSGPTAASSGGNLCLHHSFSGSPPAPDPKYSG